VKWGGLCKHCKGGRCHDAPTPATPALLKCPACNGAGCGHCDDGQIRVDRCPHAVVTRDVWAAFQAAQMAEKGVLPVAGGMLDQTQSFADAVALIWQDDSTWRAALKVIPGM
jgi:hypothetical protein